MFINFVHHSNLGKEEKIPSCFSTNPLILTS